MKRLIAITAVSLLFSTGMTFASDKATPHWTYKGPAGPESWGGLSDKFATCGTGMAQSPIDISEVNGETSALRMSYHETALNIVNNGHTIQLNYAAGSKLYSAGQEYDLLQLHFHSTSEHTVDGKYFPLEMHLVHQASDGTLAVVGVMFQEGAENVELAKIWNNMPKKANGKFTSEMTVSAAGLLPEDQSYTRYAGSLTTPPCSEGVKWHVMKSPLTISKGQIAEFLSIIHENNRPIQPLNGRKLREYTP